MTPFSRLALAFLFSALYIGTVAVEAATFHIKAQDVSTALTEFARQANLQILFKSDRVKGYKTNAIAGEYEAADAIAMLLKDTGLTAWVREGNVLVVDSEKNRPVSSDSSNVAQVADLQLARADMPSSFEGENQQMQQASPSPSKGEGDATAQKTRRATETRQADVVDETAGVPEILVKGRRNLNVDIRRTEDDPQPYVVFEREEIQRSQATNLEDFFKTRMPMNAASATASQTTGDSAVHSSSIDLRGLGADQTLILVNGRRMPGVALGGFTQQSDVNGIPLAAIERIEILPSTAGGIYGGNATGGVVNIILRGDYSGLDANVTYANTFDTDASSTRLDLNAGFSLEGGRTHITVAASTSRATSLLVGDRDFTTRGLELKLHNNPEDIESIFSAVPLGATPNVFSSFGVPLVLDEIYGGTALISNITGQPTLVTHLPMGYAGPASDGGAALLANAGRYNTDLPAGMGGAGLGLVATPTVESATLSARREFSEHIEAFVDASWLGNKGSGLYANSPKSIGLPFDAPNNPFQQDILVRFPTPNLSYPTRTEVTTLRATGGIIARLPLNWTAELGYGWSRSSIEQINAFWVVDDVAYCVMSTGLPAAAGCASGDPRPALNVLQEGNTFPIDFSPYLLPTPNQFIGPYDSTLKNASLRFSGPLVRLPGGPLNLAAMVERREETMEDAYYKDILQAPTPDSVEYFYFFYPERAQDAESYYLEARAPLISARNARPWAQALELQASVRHDSYETSSPLTNAYFLFAPEPPTGIGYASNRVSSTDYTLAVRFAPLEDLMLRASVGTGFFAPTVSHISPRMQIASFSFGADPKRGFTPTYVGQPVTLITGGNENLKPEKSDSWSAGVVLTPRALPGLRLSVDYTRIEKTDEIGSLAFQSILDNEDNLPEGRIVRGEKLSTDDPDWAGPITLFDASFVNASKSSLEAYDLQADYTVATGRGELHWYTVATWQPYYISQLVPTVAPRERVGTFGGPLEWRGNMGLLWRRGPLTLGWNAQYYNAHRPYTYTASPAQAAQAVLDQGAEMIPSQTYHDLTVGYNFEDAPSFSGGLLVNTEINVSIQNVLNKAPPILAITNAERLAYSPYGDPRLRRYSISIRKSFGLH
jgi:outer membrane receptor protein involved in Fe transport